jgi:hypothetical protein
VRYFVLLIFPLVLFLINANWPFQDLGGMDPWYYFGTFIHFPHYQHLRPTYAGERLPWILPGFLLDKLFPPAYGDLVLHFCCFSIALLSLFYLVRHLTNDRTALLAAALMGGHPIFIAANGWAYLDGGCITYLLLTFVCLMRSRSGHTAAWLLAAGACWAALVYTYIFWIVLTPCCVIFYLGLTPPSPWEGRRVLGFLSTRDIVAGGHFIGGALGLTAGLQSVHLLIFGAGHGFFFRNNIASALTFGSSDNHFVEPGYGWLTSNTAIVFAAATFVVSAAALLRHRSGSRPLSKAARTVLWCYIYAFLILVLFTVYKVRILAFSYYADMLVPLLFLALAVTALPVPKNLPRPLFTATLAVGFILPSLPLWDPRLHLSGLPSRLSAHYSLAIAGAMLPLVSGRRSAWALCVACLSAVSFGLMPQHASVAWRMNYDGLGASIRVGDAIRRIEASLPYNAYPVFWIDNFGSPYTAEYRAIMCSFLAHSASMWHYPKVDVGVDSKPASFPPGTAIILITEKRDVFGQAADAMAEMGMRLRLTGQQLVARDDVSYWLTFTEVLNPREAPGVVPDAVRLPLSDGLRLAYEKASLEKAGRTWRVVTAPQQWAYAVGILLPKVSEAATVRVRGRVVRGRVGLGLLNKSGQFTTETFVDGPFAEAEVSLPVDLTDVQLIVRNAGNSGPSEVMLDSVYLSVAAVRIADLAVPSAKTAAFGGAPIRRSGPATVLAAPLSDSEAASIPFTLKGSSRDVFYLEVRAQVQTGELAVSVLDRNNKEHSEKAFLDGGGAEEDVFVRLPPGLKDGNIEFRTAAGTGIRSRVLVSNVILWRVI